MRSELRTAIAVLATTAVLMGSATMALAADDEPVVPEPAATTTATPEPTPTPTPEPTPEPTPTPEPVPSGSFAVTDAQVRWGVNDESNNRAFAPGTFNFFSAGTIADPGRGGVALQQSGWSQRAGNVAIEKYLGDAWTPATWAGLRTTSTGAAMSGTNGPFSNHEVVISGGTGTVDPAAGTASIRWSGSFTVLYYSGYSFFHVSDPQLTVAGGVGRLTGTLSGYRSSMEDVDTWQPVAPRPGVVLAELGRVDLAADLGFSATPAYRGVAVSVPGGSSPQVRSGAGWGSFPQSFVDFQTSSGTGAYWYSSGGAADVHKVASPVTVSYSAAAPVRATPPATRSTRTPKDADEKATPAQRSVPAPAPAPVPAAVAAPSSAPVVPSAADQVLAGTAQIRPVSTVTGAPRVVAGDDRSDATGTWILSGVLVVAAALVTASPFAHGRLRAARPPSHPSPPRRSGPAPLPER